MKKIILLITSVCYLTPLCAQNHHWGYQGEGSPEHWGEMEEGKQCGIGKYQSPINILNSKTDRHLSKLKFNYNSGEIKDIEDNGHSLQFDFKEGSTLMYDNKIYTLAQFHAHEESEHTIDGVRYPLELHFVHRAADGSVLVIAVMVKEGAENSYFENLKVFKALGKHQKINTDISFNPEKMYPKNKSYYTYIGSLTTPPCAENVTWIVFKNSIQMTENEVIEIAQHLPKSNNRPIQPLNGRIIKNN